MQCNAIQYIQYIMRGRLEYIFVTENNRTKCFTEGKGTSVPNILGI